MVSYRYGNGGWRKWVLLSKWSENYPPNYRQELPSEMVFESDFTAKENKHIADQICAILREKNISYTRYFSGNKSRHIHSFFNKLANLPDTLRTPAKVKLAKHLLGTELSAKLDKSNFGPKHLIQVAGEKNPKTGKPKVLEEAFAAGRINELPPQIIEMLQISTPTGPKIVFDKKNFLPRECPFAELSFSEWFPDGSGRQNKLAPNIAALTRNHANKCELRAAFYAAQFDSKPKSLECWDTVNSTFSCKQLRNYAKSISKGNVCINHLLKVKK